MNNCSRALLLVVSLLSSATLCAQPQSFPTDASYTVGFTPGEALPLVIKTIQGARSTIALAAYSFTSKPVALALLDAHKRGVKVALVVDANDAAKTYSAARFLANQGVPVRANARYAIQHNKFLVVDQVTVQTGSLNYTAAAGQRNAENVLVLRNAPLLAASYLAEWQRLWDEAVDLHPRY